MIVREIKDDPSIIDDFDWFNDYDDTRRWANLNCPELTGRLDRGYRAWIENRRQKENGYEQ